MPTRSLRIVAFVAIIFASISSHAQLPPLQEGDLLFQNLDCGPLCDAIEEVTNGYDDSSFSHIGLAVLKHDSIMVVEAIGKDVHLTTIDKFTARSPHKIYVGRLKKPYQKLAHPAATYAISSIGVPYDDVFIYNNNKYYCSELVYDAFKKANNNKPFFSLRPMTFCKPQSKDFYPAWIDYYKKIGKPIPQGKPGINPGGISLSSKIEIIN
ncbi:MAG: hypothetical protein JST70_09670 [Bacteroidetes bacterium]|nr:hypothetical protein [Bacteroidota bacterium]